MVIEGALGQKMPGIPKQKTVFHSHIQDCLEERKTKLNLPKSSSIVWVFPAIMPPDRNSDFDDHLRRGVHELNSLEEDVVITVFVCYSRKNVPTLAEEGKIVHPANILEDLRAASYKVSVWVVVTVVRGLLGVWFC